jgi:hypothetical protein
VKTSLLETNSTQTKAYGWKLVWFAAHVGMVYLLVTCLTPWLAGWVQGSMLPLLGWPKSVSQFQFLFSHILALSFVPGFFAALANVRFKQNVVAYVWLVPALVLSYKVLTFPTVSVLQSHASSALHHYFGGGFSIPEYRNWQEFWSITTANPDMERGMGQMHFTAPFYAGVAYSIAGWIGARIDLRHKLSTKVAEWEDAKFGPRQA